MFYNLRNPCHQTYSGVVSKRWLFAVICCLSLSFTTLTVSQAHAALVTIDSGTMSITYDGAVFANVNSTPLTTTSGQDYMRYGRFWAPSETVKGPLFTPKQPQEFRALPITGLGLGPGGARQPNFRDNRATLDPLYPQTSPTNVLGVNGSGPIANSQGRNRLSTNLTFDSDNVLGTVSGLVQTNGVSSWWWANNAIIDQGPATLNWGDLSLRFDPSRVNYNGLGYSGWVFANQLGGIGDIFDTKNVMMVANASGITLSGELWGSDGTSEQMIGGQIYNENFATWPTYTLMNSDLKLGSFSFSGFSATAVPEPSTYVLAFLATIAGGFYFRHRRKQLALNSLAG